MFMNLINRYDFIDLFARISARSDDLFAVFRSRNEKIKKRWDNHQVETSAAFEPIIARANFLVSGDPQVSRFEYASRKYLKGKKVVAASLGCGSGEHEISWARQGAFARIDGFDISPKRIETARDNARQADLDSILQFRCEDVFRSRLPAQHYDVFILESALHHFSPLRDVMELIKSSLKPGGLIFVYDFVGPNRFQWLPRQLQVVNALLDLLPERYKQRTDGRLFERRFKPSLLRMYLADPSEAIDSANILSTLDEHFTTLELKNAGGAILYHLFPRLIHNFPHEDQEAQRWLNVCIEVEDLLMDRVDKIGWWYAFGVFTTR